jgi:hypothetical protein
MLGIGGRRNVADEHDALLSTEETAATSTTTTVREGHIESTRWTRVDEARDSSSSSFSRAELGESLGLVQIESEPRESISQPRGGCGTSSILYRCSCAFALSCLLTFGVTIFRRIDGGGRLSAAALGDVGGYLEDAEATFNSPACQWRLDRATQENLRCKSGGTDVVVVPDLKAVYVDITKAASESIRDRLSTVYNVSWSIQEQVSGRDGEARSTTATLSDEVLKSYTFFTFVRNPSVRFASGYRQAFCRSMCQGCERGKTPTQPPTVEQVIDVLEILRTKSRLSAKFCSRDDEEASFLNNPWLDEHFESMITRLSGVTHRGTRVPIHFIGRIESLDRDWNRLLDELNVNLNHPVRKPLAHVEHECAVPERERYLKAQSDAFHSHVIAGKRVPDRGELYEPVDVLYTRGGVSVRVPKPSTQTGKYLDRFKTLYEDDYRCLGY